MHLHVRRFGPESDSAAPAPRVRRTHAAPGPNGACTRRCRPEAARTIAQRRTPRGDLHATPDRIGPPTTCPWWWRLPRNRPVRPSPMSHQTTGRGSPSEPPRGRPTPLALARRSAYAECRRTPQGRDLRPLLPGSYENQRLAGQAVTMTSTGSPGDRLAGYPSAATSRAGTPVNRGTTGGLP